MNVSADLPDRTGLAAAVGLDVVAAGKLNPKDGGFVVGTEVEAGAPNKGVAPVKN